MNEHDLFQAVIAATYILSMACLSVNRYVVGMFIGLAGVPAWWFSAAANDQWGLQIVAGVITLIYILGLIGRWPRRAKKVEGPDEHETESI